MKPSVTAFLFVVLSLFAHGQNEDRPDRCHTVEFHQQNMQNPEYAIQHGHKMEQIKAWIRENRDGAKMDCDEILYIPVAVHFQTTGGTDIGITPACAEEMALSQIDAINADFAGTNADITKWQNGQATWPGIQNGESCVQFCLATLNHPAGSGIAEGNYAITLNEYADIDNIPEWSGYMNWFVRDITNPLGYSPLGGNGNGDGVVCGLAYFGTSACAGNLSPTFNLGRTITHEVGHYLSLSHPFDSGNCTADGDGVADTPFTDNSTFGCFPDGDSFVNCTEPVLWPTYMEYCDDACLYMWTQDQVTQMEAHVNANLTNLLDNATTKCEDAACIDIAMNVTSIDESCSFGDDGSITINVTNGNAPIQYSINGGISFQDNSVITGLEADRYDIMILDASGCELIDSVFLERETPPINIVSVTNAFCGNSEGAVLADVAFNDVFEYNIGSGWQDTSFFDGLAPGIYDLEVRNATGCTNLEEVTIGDDTDLNLQIRRQRPVNCPLFDNGLIDASLLNGEPPFEYRLNQENLQDNGLYENLTSGLYTLSVEDQRGCKTEYEFSINVSFANIGEDCPCQVFVPNAMTPDGDGLNDVLRPIPSCPITDYTFQVFDRWGDIVFETRDQNMPWNGGENDFYVKTGLYFYKITYRWGEEFNESLELQLETGTITVLR